MRDPGEAYGELVARLRGELVTHCYRLVGSREDAEDAVQEALIRAWKGLPSFKGRSSLRSWLYRIATNASLDQIKRRPPHVVPINGADPDDPRDRTEFQAERRESVGRALTAARRLPKGQRRVLFQRVILGYSAAETAEALGTSVAGVNSALQRARATIRERTSISSPRSTARKSDFT